MEQRVSTTMAIRAFCVDPTFDRRDEITYPIITDRAFPMIRDILYKTDYESGLLALRHLIAEKGAATIPSTLWTAVCTGSLIGLPSLSWEQTRSKEEQAHHSGGLCAIKRLGQQVASSLPGQQ